MGESLQILKCKLSLGEMFFKRYGGLNPVGSLNPRSLLSGSKVFLVREVHADWKVQGLVSFLPFMFCSHWGRSWSGLERGSALNL